MTKVLIVDDDRSKLASVIRLLEATGVPRSEIDIAQTGVDARAKLVDKRYDLLILDIALPLRAENPPNRRGGIDLLDEVIERDLFKRPSHVVGLTSYDDLKAEFDSKFSSRLWTLDHYDGGDTGWIDRLKARVEYLISSSRQEEALSYGTDVCVITALPFELSALRGIDWRWSRAEALDGVSFYYKGGFESQGRSFSVVAAVAPRMGMVAAALLSMKLIAKFRPRLFAMIGICAGLQGNCNIGDVLIADPTWDWQMGKYSEKMFQIAPDQIDIPTEIVERFKQLREDRTFWFNTSERYSGVKPNHVPDLRVGPVASGSAVLADVRLLDEIKVQHRKLLGVEMELYGVYLAGKDCAPPRPITFGLKAVSDFAGAEKNDDYQRFAAYMSANALMAFCERYAPDFCAT